MVIGAEARTARPPTSRDGGSVEPRGLTATWEAITFAVMSAPILVTERFQLHAGSLRAGSQAPGLLGA